MKYVLQYHIGDKLKLEIAELQSSNSGQVHRT